MIKALILPVAVVAIFASLANRVSGGLAVLVALLGCVGIVWFFWRTS